MSRMRRKKLNMDAALSKRDASAKIKPPWS
jgi:hypothetical protein